MLKGITLDIQVYNDYVVPNTVVDDGTVTANYFQHLPYLEDFNAQNGTHIASIAAMAPRRVVYVSCDPATLGRDVKRFGELGYRAVRACAVDMSPATRHVESVVLLERS